ncbi:MAG: hypothetical protein ACUVYA_15620 [Planctomycetota bacterium]
MEPHEAYYRSLSRRERHLLALREILYEGSWDEMVQDLLARKEGKPFVYKLNACIEEDLERIGKLRSYETQHEVNLGSYVALSVQPEATRDP